MNESHKTYSPEEIELRRARMDAARAKRWAKPEAQDEDQPQPDQPNTPEALPDPEPAPQADPIGTVRDRNGKVVANPGDANIIRNIWAYARPYCPNREELQAIQDARKSIRESLCPA